MMQSVHQSMQQAVTDRIFSGAQLLVVRKKQTVWRQAYGVTDCYSGTPVTLNTLFDLASLTKPLATALGIMVLVQENKLGLEQQLWDVLPAFQGKATGTASISQLLYHTAGLTDYRPYYLTLKDLPAEERRSALKNLLTSEPLISVPGTTVRYSDIGFMILEWVVEQTAGIGLDSFVKDVVYDPLGVRDLFYVRHEISVPDKVFAATEQCPWRKKTLCGEVHDDNAWIMGGVAGHAGLFGTADAVSAVLGELLAGYCGDSGKTLFLPEIVSLFLRKAPAADRALGFDMPSPAGSSSGDGFTPDHTIGHLGFTGTSFWMDLEKQIYVILLTNRVHPTRENNRIREFRPVIHNLVMQELKDY